MANKDDNSQDSKASDAERVRQAVETGKTPEDESKGKDDAADKDADAGADDDSQDGDGSGDDSGDGATDDDSGADNGSDDDKSDDDADDDSKPRDASTKPRFTQFAGDGKPETYLSNLEKGYENSSAEAIRLNQELGQQTGRLDAIMKAAATDPELATKLNNALKGASDAGGSGADGNSTAVDNPFVRSLQSEWEETSGKEIEAFIEANPEVASDPKISADVKKWMNIFSRQHYEDTGRLMSGGKAMAAAYRHLGLENKLEKQNLADGAKKAASPTRSRGKPKATDGKKPAFTPAQIEMAKAMGKDEDWLLKNAQ